MGTKPELRLIKGEPKRESAGTYSNLLAEPKLLTREALERAIEELRREPNDLDRAKDRRRVREELLWLEGVYGPWNGL
jgi:hypothetical protein